MDDYATRDLILAILHHVLIFAILAVLVAELVIVSLAARPEHVRRLAIIDRHYGLLAVLILVVGFTRATQAAKGWDYYAHNHFFWAKMSVFLVMGLVSIEPTLRILRWKRGAKKGQMPAPGEVARVRKCLWIELGLFALLPIFAAAMARGYGSP